MHGARDRVTVRDKFRQRDRILFSRSTAPQFRHFRAGLGAENVFSLGRSVLTFTVFDY